MILLLQKFTAPFTILNTVTIISSCLCSYHFCYHCHWQHWLMVMQVWYVILLFSSLFFFLFSLSFNWNSKYLKCYEQPKTFPLGFRQKEFLMACPFGNVQVGRGLFALYDDPPPFFLLSFWCEPLGFTRGPSCRRHLLVERWGDSSECVLPGREVQDIPVRLY